MLIETVENTNSWVSSLRLPRGPEIEYNAGNCRQVLLVIDFAESDPLTFRF
jgi:hypothetical protein